MGKTRVHLLAKELGIETKDLIAQLDKLGMRGRKAQSALEDDEVARVRAALTALEKPQVHVGEEKVVADRVVKSEEEGDGGAEARETVVERRVRANVIRRRVNRTEVAAPAETPMANAEAAGEPALESAPSALDSSAPAALGDEAHSEIAPEIEAPSEWSEPADLFKEIETAPMETTAAESASIPAPMHAEAENRGADPLSRPKPVTQEAPRGARIL